MEGPFQNAFEACPTCRRRAFVFVYIRQSFSFSFFSLSLSPFLFTSCLLLRPAGIPTQVTQAHAGGSPHLMKQRNRLLLAAWVSHSTPQKIFSSPPRVLPLCRPSGEIFLLNCVQLPQIDMTKCLPVEYLVRQDTFVDTFFDIH